MNSEPSKDISAIANENKTTGTASVSSSSETSAMSVKDRFKTLLKNLGRYFNVKNDLESQADIEASIRSSVSFKGSQLLILIFAIFIASLGLNTNSVAVIIGAMLISPLMGPIIGMGLGIGIQDFNLL